MRKQTIEEDIFSVMVDYEIFNTDLSFVFQVLYNEYVGNVEYQNSRLEPEDDFGIKPILSFREWIEGIQKEGRERFSLT